MKAILYFVEGILQVILGILTVVHAVKDSEKVSKAMNMISGTGFVVLGVLNCIAGGMKVKEQHPADILVKE